MAKIEREYYSINEASKIICCSVADLVHLATKGEVKFIVLTSGLPAQRIRQNIIEEKQPYEFINDKFCYVSQDNVAVFEANHSNDDLYITWVYTDDDLEHGWGLHSSSLIPATNDSLYMLTADINALLNDPPETEGAEKQQVINKIGKESKNRPKIFEKRLAVLKKWLKDDLKLILSDETIILPKHYTLELVYNELGKKDDLLFLCIEIGSFDAHFWGKQKIVELMRGNKTTIM
ncbi:MAG: hypothetical protein RIR39_2547 [Pseudomonadota bacterium]|jgi:hypothetical protein